MKKIEKGKPIKLPCNMGDTVYFIEEDNTPCEVCEIYLKRVQEYTDIEGDKIPTPTIQNKSTANAAIQFSKGCLNTKGEWNCPPPKYSIKEGVCEGFRISSDEFGDVALSNPGRWDGRVWDKNEFVEYKGCNNKVYFSYEEAFNDLLYYT